MMDVHDTLDKLVPEPTETSDWDAVLRDARPRRRPLVLQLAVATVVAAAAALFVAAPWNGSERVGILDRALAAVGEGPVLHLVMRDEAGAALVDLETGARTRASSEQEMWIDPARGFVAVSRFNGVVTERRAVPPEQIEEPFVVGASDYHDALESGRATVVGSGVVEGEDVYWIEVAGGGENGRAIEVGVSKATYKPVYIRETLDGRPVERTGTRILDAEQVPADAADFTPTPQEDLPVFESARSPEPISVREASEELGGRAFWLGTAYGALPLATIHKLTLGPGAVPGIHLVYGDSVGPEGQPRSLPFVTIDEAARSHPLLERGIPSEAVPEGHAVVSRDGFALARLDGIYIAIVARVGRDNEEAAQEVATQLSRISAGNGGGG
jgi:hypothetical protein